MNSHRKQNKKMNKEHNYFVRSYAAHLTTGANGKVATKMFVGAQDMNEEELKELRESIER